MISVNPKCNYLNAGFSTEITPTSISEDLKSADNTVDRQVMAICNKSYIIFTHVSVCNLWLNLVIKCISYCDNLEQ